MIIQKEKNTLYLSDKVSQFVINPLEKDLKEENSVFLSTSKLNDQVISEVGEFERHDIYVKTISSATSPYDIAKVLIEDVNVLYLYPTIKKLTADEVDSIGVVDILVLNLDNSLSEYDFVSEIISEIDPSVVVLLNQDPERVLYFNNKLGIIFEETKKIKAMSSDFNPEDEKMIKGYSLN